MATLLFKWFFASLLAGIPNTAANYSNKKTSRHPFNVSVIEINHNAAEKSLEISCKIFTDDFEIAILKSNGVRIDLFNSTDKQLANKQIFEYLKKHLLIKLDNAFVTLEFVGFERENEAIWSYLQVSRISAPKKVDITNKVLYESFEKQINLMHISVGGSRKSTKLNNPDANASFMF